MTNQIIVNEQKQSPNDSDTRAGDCIYEVSQPARSEEETLAEAEYMAWRDLHGCD